jgi:hypothetical protein
MFIVLGFLLWLNFGTEYALTQTELKYKSGLISGNIDLQDTPIDKRRIDVVGHYASPDVFNFSVNK